MSKRKAPAKAVTKPVPKISRDLPASNPIHKQPEETEQEEQLIESPYEPPVVAEQDLVTCDGPIEVVNGRRQRVLAITQEAIRAMLGEMIEELAFNPNIPQYIYQLSPSFPPDVVSLIVASLHKAGWNVQLQAESRLWIEMPLVPLLAPDLVERKASTVAPL